MGEEGLEPAEESRSSQALGGNAANSEAPDVAPAGPSRSSAESTVTLSHDSITEWLEAAHAAWLRTGDEKTLRRALLDLLWYLERTQ